jgi:hypothetical protein
MFASRRAGQATTTVTRLPFRDDHPDHDAGI